MKLNIDPDLENYLTQPKSPTDDMLTALIKRDGGVGHEHAITVWEGKGVIVDGHRRYRICQELDLPFAVVEQKFKDIDQVKSEMRQIQLSRRNSTGRVRDSLMTEELEYQRSMGAGKGDSLQAVADSVGTTTRTVRRASKRTEAEKKLPQEVSDRIKSGDLKASQRDVIALAAKDHTEIKEAVATVDSGDCKTIHEALRQMDDTPEFNIRQVKSDARAAAVTLLKALDALQELQSSPRHQSVIRKAKSILECLDKW
jgi:ParB-like chromosome segregation protein Spo0J